MYLIQSNITAHMTLQMQRSLYIILAFLILPRIGISQYHWLEENDLLGTPLEMLNDPQFDLDNQIDIKTTNGHFTLQIKPNDFLSNVSDAKGFQSFDILQFNNRLVTGRGISDGNKIYFHLLTEHGLVSFTPNSEDNSYAFQHKSNEEISAIHKEHVCGNNPEYDRQVIAQHQHLLNTSNKIVEDNGETIRTFRVAIVCTYEFFTHQGANSQAYAAAILDGISLIFNQEMSVNLVLAQMPAVFETSNDPFDPDQLPGSDGRTNQASEVVPTLFDGSQFDIGHVFHLYGDAAAEGWSSGGVALLQSVCSEETYASNESDNPDDGIVGINKAAAWSGTFSVSPITSFIRLASHEFGHQFGATHTFKGDGSACTDAYSAETAYEIGSGTTIMSYRGICDPSQNIPSGGLADDYFHTASLVQMINFVESPMAACANESTSNNAIPETDANPCGINNIVVPRATPFILEGEAIDADGDPLLYCWEQYDNGGPQGAISTNAANNFFSPIFRSYPPTESPSRYFPPLFEVVNNIPNDFDILSNVPRDLDFQFTVRDGAAVSTDDLNVTVDDDGPLEVTSPTNGQTWDVGQSFTVDWELNGSALLCDNVDILLSIDGGFNFSIPLASNVSYSAMSFTGTLPLSVPRSDNAKVMVVCADYECVQFYNVNAGTISINSDCDATEMVICDTETIVGEEGNTIFQLDPIGITADFVFDLNVDISAADPQHPYFGEKDGACAAWVNRRINLDTFRVSEDGRYRFTREMTDQFLTIYTIEGLDLDNACPNYVGSNLRHVDGGGYFPSSDLELELESCQTYVLASATAAGSVNFTVSIIPVAQGSFYLLSSHEPGFETGYIAVNTATGLVQEANIDADFTSLPAGEYEVYAIAYKATGAEPPANIIITDLEGSSILPLLNQGNCFKLSDDFKLLVVNALMNCSIDSIVPFPENFCLDTETYDQNFIVYYSDLPQGSNTINVNGNSFPAPGGQNFITLTGLPADGSTMMIDIFLEQDPDCANSFFYTNPGMSTGLSVEVNSIYNLCEGESITAISDLATSYSWEAINSGNVYFGNPFTPIEDGVYRLTVFDDAGCQVEEFVDVTFEPTPTVSFTEGDAIQLCSSPSYQFFPENSGSLFNEWQIINFDQSDTIFIPQNFGTPMAEATITGTYIVTVGNTGCSASDTIEVVVTPSPEVFVPEDTVVCGIDFITIDAEVQTPLDVTLSWTDEDDNEISSDEEASFFNSGTYTFSATDENGCVDTADFEVDFQESLDVTIIGDQDTSFCEGEQLLIEAFTGAAVNVSWIYTNGVDIDTSNIFGAYSATESGTLIAYVELNGCEAKDTIELSEVAPPGFLLQDNIEPNKPLCPDCPVTLTALTNELGISFDWTGPLGTSLGIQNSIGPDQTANTGTYYVTALSDETGCSSIDSIELEYLEAPEFQTESPVLQLCDGTLDTIRLSSVTADFLTWFFCEDLSGNCIDVLEVGSFSSLKDFEVEEAGFYVAEAAHSLNGCFYRDTIEVVLVDAPNVDIGDTFQRACEGDEYILTTGENPEDGVDYSWYISSPSNIINGENSNELIVTEDGNYGFIATDGNCEVSSEVTVDFVDFRFCLNEGVDTLFGCLTNGNGLTLIYSQCDGEGFPNNIEWFKDGDSAPFATESVSVNVMEEGLYYMNATEPVADCFYSDSIYVVFSDPPPVDLGVDTTVCGGDVITLNTGLDGFIHEWDFGGEIQMGETGSTITFSPTEDQPFVTIIVTIYQNDPNCFSFDTKTIFVAKNPEIVDWVDSLAICSGESVDLVVFDEFQTYDFQWFFDDQLIESEDDDTYTAEEGGNYSVIVTNEICSDTLFAFVNEGMVDPVDLGEDLTICPGESVLLEPEGEYDEYLWLPTGDLDPSLELSLDSGFEGEVSIILQAQNDGCTSRDTLIAFFSSPITEAEIIPSQTEICFGDSLLLQAVSGPNYLWTPSESLSSDSIANVIAYPQENTTYSLTVFDDCPGNEATTDISITVFPEATVGIMNDTTVVAGSSFSLSAFGGEEYIWNNIALIQGSNEVANPTVIVNDSTTFEVLIIDENGCEYYEDVRINVFINPEDLVKPISIITPNGDGINDELIFDGLEAFSDSHLVIFNRWGNIVYEQDGYQLNGELWDGANGGVILPADVYYYVLEFGEQSIKNTITITREN